MTILKRIEHEGFITTNQTKAFFEHMHARLYWRIEHEFMYLHTEHEVENMFLSSTGSNSLIEHSLHYQSVPKWLDDIARSYSRRIANHSADVIYQFLQLHNITIHNI